MVMKKVDLICLPFAGGNKYSYRGFEEKAPSFIQIVSLNYPGRSNRANEPLLTDIKGVVKDTFRQLKDLINGQDYALYGHSMGALVAILSAREISRHLLKLPLRLFVTGTIAPAARTGQEEKFHYLDKKEFLDKIISFEGLPQEIIQDQELLDYYEPILRADFTATESYRYQEASPLDIPLTVINGTDEDIKNEDVQLWQKETKRVVDFMQMPGKHFFIFKNAAEVMNVISDQLQSQVQFFKYE